MLEIIKKDDDVSTNHQKNKKTNNNENIILSQFNQNNDEEKLEFENKYTTADNTKLRKQNKNNQNINVNVGLKNEKSDCENNGMDILPDLTKNDSDKAMNQPIKAFKENTNSNTTRKVKHLNFTAKKQSIILCFFFVCVFLTKPQNQNAQKNQKIIKKKIIVKLLPKKMKAMVGLYVCVCLRLFVFVCVFVCLCLCVCVCVCVCLVYFFGKS